MSTVTHILVERIKAGDHSAFRELFFLLKDPLYNYAYRFTRNRELAEETLQEVFLKLWQRRDLLDETGAVKAYLYTMTRNHVFNLLKRAVYDEQLKEVIFHRPACYEPSPEEQLILHEVQAIREKAISSLPPRRQQIFRMSRAEGLSHEEIAGRLGISRNTVKDQIVKASQAIREYLYAHSDIVLPLFLLLNLMPAS